MTTNHTPGPKKRFVQSAASTRKFLDSMPPNGMQPKIDKNVPIPIPLLRRNKYPLGKMEIGDSFFATDSGIRSSVCVYVLRHPPRKYKVGKEKDGYRVWRIK